MKHVFLSSVFFSIHTGPMHWPSLFPNCAKGRQSPIDINTETAKYNDKLNDINMIPISTKNVWNLGNNGHAGNYDT